MMSVLHLDKSRIDPLGSFYKSYTTVDVLRLDLLHSVISGNKWFKLKEYLADARQQHKNTIVTFGGAFSNHIVATAAAAKQAGFKSVGIIRGERPALLSPTLLDALSFDMKLFFISREEYKKKQIPRGVQDSGEQKNLYFINEGGYGYKGMLGAKDILAQKDMSQYTHIMAAVGTGTTLAGLIAAANEGQTI